MSNRMLNPLKWPSQQDQTLHDVTFVFDVKPEHGKDVVVCYELSSQKSILSAGSTVFKEMLSGPLAETNIEMGFVNPHAFEKMLCYLHKKKIDLSESTVAEVLQLADKFDLAPLKQRCIDEIPMLLSRENALQLYQTTFRLLETNLCFECLAMVDKNAQYIITKKGAQFDRELFCEFLARDTFCAREIDIFEALVRWAKVNLPEESQSPRDIREFLGDLLFMVRFPLMTMKTILSRVGPTKILDDDEVMEALIHTMGKKDKTIATTLFQNTVRSLGLEVVLKRSGIPRDPTYLGDTRMERVVHKGTRVMRFQVENRLFIKSVGLSNVPFRLSGRGYRILIVVYDVDTNERVRAAEYKLTRIPHHPETPATYKLDLEPMVEVGPFINYQVNVSVEGPSPPDIKTARVVDDEGMQHSLYFNYSARVSEQEVVVDDLFFST